MKTANSAKMRCILGATLIATLVPVMSNAGENSNAEGQNSSPVLILEPSGKSLAVTKTSSLVSATSSSVAGINAGGVSGINAGGLAGINAGGISGINAGGVSGINAGGLAGINAGGVTGINAGGLSGINAGGLTGINAGGIAGINAGGVTGINAGGLSGINAGGLAGINAGGIAGINAGGVTGINAGGLSGINAGGLVGINAGGIAGINAGGVAGINAGGLSGINAGGLVGINAGGIAGINAGGVTGINAGGIAGINAGGVALEHVGVGNLTFQLETSTGILSGPVENIDAINGVFTSMGQTVLASQSMLADLSVGDLVTVDGSVMGAGWIYADTLEVSQDTYVPGATPVFVTGLISDMDQSIGRAQVGALEVDYTATLSGGDVPSATFYRFYGIQPEGEGVMISDFILAER